MGDKAGDTPGPKGLSIGCPEDAGANKGTLLQINIAQIIIHKTHQPNAFVKFLDAKGLPGLMRSIWMPRRSHQTESLLRLNSALAEAKGAPARADDHGDSRRREGRRMRSRAAGANLWSIADVIACRLVLPGMAASALT